MGRKRKTNMGMKFCPSCKEIKSVNDFYPDKYNPTSGYRSYCKVCSKARDEQSDYCIARNARRSEYRVKVLTHYGNGKLGCVHCGESRLACLIIDHINGDGAEQRRQLRKEGSAFYEWLITQNFPPGYQTLCYNCNMVKSYLYRERIKRLPLEQRKAFHLLSPFKWE